MRTIVPLRAALVAACFMPFRPAPASDWLQWGYDASHTGQNTDEYVLGPGNVSQLTRRYQASLPSSVDSAPVYRSNVATANGVRNLLFVQTENGHLVALDAADGSVVWNVSTSGRSPTEASPAIDPFDDYIYAYGLDGKAHKYHIGDGGEVTDGGWPQVATLKPSVEKGAAGLAIATSSNVTRLYVVNDGYIGDCGDYQGHLTTIDLATGAQRVFNSLCSDIGVHMVLNGTNGIDDCSERQSGIWGRPGATYDADTDRVYITTGNGLFNANTGGLQWGDSVLALNADGSGMGAGLPRDSYTPTTYQQLDGGDVDLGSASLIVLQPPAGSVVQHIGLQTGKDSKLHLIDLDDMSGTGAPGGVGGAIEVIDVPISEFWAKTQPVTWVDPSDGSTWVYMANGVGISGLKLTLTAQNMPHLQPTWQQASDSTSALIAGGMVFHAGACGGNTCLIARDPRTGSVLWTSATVGGLHWQSPILVDGALYIAAGSTLHRFDTGTAPLTHAVTSTNDGHGALSPSWPQTVVDGAPKTFVLRPDRNYSIESVSGCGGTLSGNSYTTAPITADCTVSATFALVSHTVTPVAGPNGSIAPDTPQNVLDGDATSFTLTADAHYAIDTVEGCGGSLAGNVYTTGPVTADCTVTASFAPITHTVTPVVGANGSIAPDTPQTVDDGATVQFTLTPAAHYAIGEVSGCGGTLAGNVYTTGAISADCSVNATFVAITHVVTPGVSGNGTIAPDTPQTVVDGATASFVLAPAAGEVLQDVSGCGGTLAGLIYTTGPVTADCSVDAVFSADPDVVFRDGFELLVR